MSPVENEIPVTSDDDDDDDEGDMTTTFLMIGLLLQHPSIGRTCVFNYPPPRCYEFFLDLSSKLYTIYLKEFVLILIIFLVSVASKSEPIFKARLPPSWHNVPSTPLFDQENSFAFSSSHPDLTDEGRILDALKKPLQMQIDDFLTALASNKGDSMAPLFPWIFVVVKGVAGAAANLDGPA